MREKAFEQLVKNLENKRKKNSNLKQYTWINSR